MTSKEATPTKSGDEKVEKLDFEKDSSTNPVDYSKSKLILTVALLAFINFVSFSDRYIVPAILRDLQNAFSVETDQEMGLLQTTYLITYLVVAPFWGYLGDRFDRRIVLAVALFIWGTVSLLSAFVPENLFPLFLVLRAAVAIGQSCVTILAPTIISDLFVGSKRTLAILCYQIGLLLGSGFGFIIAGIMAAALDSWRPVFMIFPPCVLISVILVAFMPEPIRGASEGAAEIRSTSPREDVKYLLKIKSYVLAAVGFTCLTFMIGAMTFWDPTFIASIYIVSGHASQINSINLIYGIKGCVCGIVGAILGTIVSKILRTRVGDGSDAAGCGFGNVLVAPLIYVSLVFGRYSLEVMWLVHWIDNILVSFTVVLHQEILLNVVVANRRSMGNSLVLFIGHLFGDAISPYLVGLIKDIVFSDLTATYGGVNEELDYTARQQSLYLMTFLIALSGFFYLMASIYVAEDKAEALQLTKARQFAANNTANVQKEDEDF